MKKALQIPHLRASNTVSERRSASPERPREARSGRSRDELRSSSSSIAEAHSAASARSSRVAGGDPVRRRRVRSAPGSGSGPGTNFSAGLPGRRSRISAARCVELEAPDRVASCGRCSVPSRWKRAGQALRAISAPTAAGQRLDSLADARVRAVAARARASTLVTERLHRAPPRGHLEQLVGLGGQHRGVGRRDRAPGRRRATRAARMRRRSGSSSESTSSSRSSGAKPRRSAISSASASRSASTARRCSPCEPKLRRSRVPDAMTTSSRCGPSPVTPRSRSRSRRASSAATVGGSPS